MILIVMTNCERVALREIELGCYCYLPPVLQCALDRQWAKYNKTTDNWALSLLPGEVRPLAEFLRTRDGDRRLAGFKNRLAEELAKLGRWAPRGISSEVRP